MPVDTDKIKDAMDKFEEEDFITAKEILQKEIHQAKNDYLKTKLELEQDVDEACKKKAKKVVVQETEEEE